jgi:alanine racemase
MLLDLEISIHHLDGLRDIEHLDENERKKLKLHLKVNTGMGRLGLQKEEIEQLCQRARELGISFRGLFTTFASSDTKDNPLNVQQLERYKEIVSILLHHGFDPPLKHIANSGAVLNLPNALLTMVRPGLLLHGLPPYPGPPPEGFRPIARLESEIIQISDHPAGTSIGYSAAFITKRATRAAVIPIGYADGLNRLLSNKGEVLVHGKRVPIIGKISMDLTIIDITDIDPVALGDTVTIIGVDGDEEITAWEMAETIDSIPWEIFCWIGPRVPRIYTRDDES